MFGWRKKQIAEQVAKDIDDSTETPEVELPEEKFDNSEAIYTVGKNKAGHTQIRIKLEYGSATLTMAPDAVIELIEQLSATIRKQYNVEINEVQNDIIQPEHC